MTDPVAAGPTLALTVAYDGTRFAGSQVQPGQRSVQGELEAALGRLGRADGRTVFAGRTDRGVHAAGQVVSLPDAWPGREPERLRRAINAHLPEDVTVRAVERRADGFHARFDATWRQYRCMIGQESPQPVGRQFVWSRPGAPLDIEAMRDAAGAFLGERDCAALAGGGQGVPWSEVRGRPRGTVRTILQVAVEPVEGWWAPGAPAVMVTVAADGFLRRMVRTIVALLVLAGRGSLDRPGVERVLASGDRRHNTTTAPAHGLTLWRVGYGDDPPWSSVTGRVSTRPDEIGRRESPPEPGGVRPGG